MWIQVVKIINTMTNNEQMDAGDVIKWKKTADNPYEL